MVLQWHYFLRVLITARQVLVVKTLGLRTKQFKKLLTYKIILTLMGILWGINYYQKGFVVEAT